MVRHIKASRLPVIIAAVLVLILASTWQLTARRILNSNVGAYVSHQPERYTELFFSDYPALPKSIEAGKTYTGQFSLASHEADTETFKYTVNRYENGTLVSQRANTATIEPGHTVILPFELSASAPGLQVTITITLDGRNEAITFRTAS